MRRPMKSVENGQGRPVFTLTLNGRRPEKPLKGESKGATVAS